MRLGLVIAIAALALSTSCLHAQTIANSLQVKGSSASTWMDGDANVVQLAGPVAIELDRTHLTAERAVIWVRPVVGSVDLQQVEIALLGESSIRQGEAVRSGQKLYVTGNLRGSIRITAAERLPTNLSDSPTYKEAQTVRQVNSKPVVTAPLPSAMIAQGPQYHPALPVKPVPTTAPSLPPPTADVRFQADQAPITHADDGTVVITMHGNLLLLVDRGKGEFFEMRADHMVLFTTFKSMEEARKAGGSVKDKIDAVYLEGDVRINYTPGERHPGPEQRLTAQRAYYELRTDRAILTDAVFHTLEPKTQMPVIMRAQTLRQLSSNEYRGDKIQLTTSTFANPSFAVAADKAYVRVEPTGDERLGDLYTFRATNITPNFFGVPAFWLPVAGGSITEHAFPLRNIGFGASSKFGTFGQSEWGLFESMGIPRPKDLDVSYRADYYTDRGFGGGLDGKYSGGFVTETTKQPWNFNGEFNSYFLPHDTGIDDVGGSRADVDPDETFRGRILWQHQHFLPGDWQAQLRAGWVSDSTFLEEWFPREWEDGQPNDLSAYFKRQRNTEALTFGINYNPASFVTDAEYAQEQFEVAHLPEIGYHRIGDSFNDDTMTFFSDNSLTAMKARRSDLSLDPTGSFFVGQGYFEGVQPGIPAVGQNGTTSKMLYRSDFRQEVDYPLNAGNFKVVPYTFARLTDYSDSPEESDKHRLMAGVGLRVNTSFWRTDDTAESDLFDIHRVRHVVEPNLNLFTSGQTVDRSDLFIYDDQVDDVYDISAASVGLSQRWQTKRGGPGRWRSVDFFTFNVSATVYANEPKNAELPPTGFRGLFFPTMPEASVPRDNINADATWRVSDDTVVIGDAQYNMEEATLATASIGLAVRRSERMNWFVGTSYVEPVNSNITTVGLNYAISTKYSFGYSQSFDFGENEDVSYAVSLNRRFDTFYLLFRATYDQTTGESGFGINLLPQGAKNAVGTDTASVFSPGRQ